MTTKEQRDELRRLLAALNDDTNVGQVSWDRVAGKAVNEAVPV